MVGKLKTLRRKRKKNLNTTWRFMPTFEADKRFRLLTLFLSLSVKKRTIKNLHTEKRHWSSLGVLCEMVTHTYTLSDCELSRHMLNISRIYWNKKWLESTNSVSPWDKINETLALKTVKRTNDVSSSGNILFFLLILEVL